MSQNVQFVFSVSYWYSSLSPSDGLGLDRKQPHLIVSLAMEYHIELKWGTVLPVERLTDLQVISLTVSNSTS